MHQGNRKAKNKTSKGTRPSATPEVLEPRYLLSGGDWGGPHPDFSIGHGGGDNRGDLVAPVRNDPVNNPGSSFFGMDASGRSDALAPSFGPNFAGSDAGYSGQDRGGFAGSDEGGPSAAPSWNIANVIADRSADRTDNGITDGSRQILPVQNSPSDNSAIRPDDHQNGPAEGDAAAGRISTDLYIQGPAFVTGDSPSWGEGPAVQTATGSFVPGSGPVAVSAPTLVSDVQIVIIFPGATQDADKPSSGISPQIQIGSSGVQRDGDNGLVAGPGTGMPFAGGSNGVHWDYTTPATYSGSIPTAGAGTNSTNPARDNSMTAQQVSAPPSGVAPAFVRGPAAPAGQSANISPSAEPASSPTFSTAQLQPASIFNGISAHHETGGFAIAGSALLIAGEMTMPHVDASYSAPAVRWIDQATGSLMTWLGGATPNAVAIAGNAAEPVGEAAAGTTASAPEVVVHAAHAAMTALAGPMLHAPANLVYRFASFDPSRTFADAMAAFAGESASMTPVEVARHHSHRAWIVTGLVIGADVLLAARWIAERNRLRKKSSVAKVPQSLQAVLPSGL